MKKQRKSSHWTWGACKTCAKRHCKKAPKRVRNEWVCYSYIGRPSKFNIKELNDGTESAM